MTSTAAIGASLDSIRTILVATDFSEGSSAAVDWASGLAKMHNAHVVIVHAIESELPALAVPPNPMGQRLQQWLSDLRMRVVAEAGVEVSVESHIDKPAKVVPAVAAKVRADVIVLGARGRTNLVGKLLGSTADRIIRTTSVPVVVVRGEPNPPSAIKSVLVACDFSEESARATSTAIKLLYESRQQVHLELFHVIPLQIIYPDPIVPGNMTAASGPVVTDEAYWRDAQQRAAQNMENLAAPLRSEQWKVDVKTARGLPGEEILREAGAVNAQLIAIGTQGRGGLNRFFMGSVAEWVLHHAKCPVLMVRKPDQDDVISLSAIT